MVNDVPATTDPVDPVLVRRARVAHLVQIGQRVGYGFLLLAIVAFGIGAAAGFPHWAATTAVVGLVGACIVLPVPIVLGYGVRAADRDERKAAAAKAARSKAS